MPAKPSAVIDTRAIYCGDNVGQRRKLPDGCVDLIYIDPPVTPIDPDSPLDNLRDIRYPTICI